jgi:plasmid maintenance system killer protein
MEFVKTAQYLRTQKKLLKKHSMTQSLIDETLLLLQNNPHHDSLRFKKMTCRKDKNRYSIRIVNTQYRMLFNLIDDIAYLVCICDHDDYDYRNKNC